jgi:hypothetical protein
MVRHGILEVVELGAEDPVKLRVFGIDLGKAVFHLVGLDAIGR